jgi:hypothetical protein
MTVVIKQTLQHNVLTKKAREFQLQIVLNKVNAARSEKKKTLKI